MAAGETLALVLECGRAHDEEFLEEYLNDLIDAVKQLATDSHKYRAKRDRKAQRATFRDVLRYLEVSFRLSNNEFYIFKEVFVQTSCSVFRVYFLKHNLTINFVK